MFDYVRRSLSSAHLIAFAALVVALGGTAYAATKIDTNDIKGKAVTKPKIDKEAVSTNRLRAGAVRAGQLGPITEVDETSPGATAPPITATADCPSGSTVIGGGFSSQPTGNVNVERSQRDGNGWKVDGLASAPGDTVTAYAYCLEG
jgi:hypothetical protein